MDWYTSTDDDLALLTDSTLDDYTDGLPTSYDLTQWMYSEDYPLSLLTDAQMDDLIDGRTPARAPWHCSLKVADTMTVKCADTVAIRLKDRIKINVHGGDAL